MRKATVATRRLTPHPNPSPEGEGLVRPPLRDRDQQEVLALLLREKGWDEGRRLQLRDRAKSMRREPTSAENILWLQLRGRRFQGHKFRRQVPIGDYIVDFLCEELALIVEVDGGQHADAFPRDQVRSDWLCKSGFRVIRFWNNDVTDNIEAVLEQLLSFAQKEAT